MKRFIAIVLMAVAVAMALDWTIGKALDSMLPQISNQGDSGKTYFSLNEVNAPVVIVGSSRAVHHYVTQMVEDSLGMPAYNVARDGCFYSYNCCVMNSILDRYSPELIIWENGREYLSAEDDPLESLYPYYDKNQWATELINEELPWTEQSRLLSKTYRYNSMIHRVVMRYVTRHRFKDGTTKGYSPLAPKSQGEPLELKSEPVESEDLNPIKVGYFRSTLERAKSKGVKVVVVDSPKYKKRSETSLSGDTMREICQDYGMVYLDNSQLPYFLEKPELFSDATHMNDSGAKIYTEMFIRQIKDYVEQY